MTKYFYILLIVVFVSCNKDEVKIKVTACFNYIPDTTLKVGDTIQFLNCSENATSYEWDFGDGSSSTEISPQHIFKVPGSFTVKLTTSKYDVIDTISKKIEVQSITCIAGVISSNMYTSSFEPYSIWWYNGEHELDLNNNNSPDIAIRQIHISSRTIFDETTYIDILDSTFQFIVTENLVYPKILNYNDTIYEKLLWSNESKIHRNKWNNVTLASKSGFWDEPTYNNYSYWLKKIGYIGIRNEYSKGHYKYGWLKIKVDDYLNLTIYKFGYMK